MILEGKNVCMETLLSGQKIKKVIMKESFNDEIIQIVQKRNISFEFLNDFEFQKLYPKAQGIVIEVEGYVYESFDKALDNLSPKPFVLILDGIEDPQNFGNIIRSFEALGGDFIIIPKNRACGVNETVARVSSGAFNYVKIVQVTNLNTAIAFLKDYGFWIAGADMKGDTLYDQLPVDTPLALVIGSEGFGISHLVRQNCDYLIRIPMTGKINSLNASISAAIIMSNIISRRK
ncbi:MAG: 23S rRNA (guanosine(2251)-2'-O)-methyltransferase RlmB [Bacillales bacterium]|nr:23S rRNA (guanosine(2251)-2'-O)-methyltransferase RlmB [Bacillales bacterium]